MESNKCWQEFGEIRALIPCWWKFKMVQPLRTVAWWFLKKLNIELPNDLATVLLDILPRE